MTVEIGNEKLTDEDDDVEVDYEPEDTLVLDDIDSDNVGDLSVEINVEELVKKLESTSSDDVDQRRQIRRRLDELREQREAEEDIDGTYNINLDDE